MKGGERKRASVPTGPLSELYVEGFDVDQIWEQVELVNGPLIAHVTKQVDHGEDKPVGPGQTDWWQWCP